MLPLLCWKVGIELLGHWTERASGKTTSNDKMETPNELKNALVNNYVKQNWSNSQTEKCASCLQVAQALLAQTRLAEAESKCYEAIDPLEIKLKAAWKQKSVPLQDDEMNILKDSLQVLEQVYRGQLKETLADNILKRITKDEWIQTGLIALNGTEIGTEKNNG